MKAKYDNGLFMAGVCLNFIKNVFIWIPAIILLFVGVWVKVGLYIGITLLILNIIVAFIEQFHIKSCVENSDTPEFEPWKEIMTSDNWKDDVKDKINNIIDSYDD